jgi:hypothetical protein
LKLRNVLIGLAAAIFFASALASAPVPASATTLICKTKKGHADVFHDGADKSHCEAVTEDLTGKASAKATGANSFSEANVDKHGKASALANGMGANGQAEAFGKCHASGKAIGTNSTAFAKCEAGGFARATATNGGEADAFDDKAPTCIAGSGATAIVHSTFANCTAP